MPTPHIMLNFAAPRLQIVQANYLVPGPTTNGEEAFMGWIPGYGLDGPIKDIFFIQVCLSTVFRESPSTTAIEHIREFE